MKGTGIVRRIDFMGRVVVPKETRRTLGIADGDPVEFFVDGDCVIIQKYRTGCVLCGASGDHIVSNGKIICLPCCKGLIECPIISA